MEIQISVDALAAMAKLGALSEAIDNKFILDEAGAFCLNRIRTRFLGEKDPDEVPWIPSIAAIIRRAHGGTGTLFDTGRLFHSIQLSAEDSDDERIISTDVPYAGYVSVKWPFMGINQGDANVLEKLLEIRIAALLSDTST